MHENNQLITQTPLGRLGQPADVANAVALLISDDAHGLQVRAFAPTAALFSVHYKPLVATR